MPYKKCDSCGQEFHNEHDFLTKSNRWRVCDRGHLWFNCNCGSTLLIRKGKHDWYSPDMALGGAAGSLFNKLSMGDLLPHIPSAVMQIQQKLEDENASSRALAELTKGAPLIAGSILKMANNLKPARSAEIKSLEHAISFVGLKTLKELVQAAGLQSFKFKSKVFDSDYFWRQATLRGMIAEKLATRFQTELEHDEVYLAASLCNIGKAVMAICFPEQVDQIETDLRNPKIMGTWVQAEKRHGFYDHRVLGEIGASFWGMPEYVLRTSLEHHVALLHKSPIEISHIVGFANQLTHWIDLTPHLMDEELLSYYQTVFGLDTSQTEAIVEKFMEAKIASSA